MWFERDKLIRFNHCDPAAIIFYPQYFVLFHEVMEDWFGEALATNYGEYIRTARLGVPAVKAECEFLSQAKLGDVVTFRLEPVRLGKASLELEGEARDGDELRARARITVVQMSLDTRKAGEGRIRRRGATRKRPSPALRAASPGAGEAKTFMTRADAIASCRLP